MAKEVKIFISYSHLDAEPKKLLEGHLKTLQRLLKFSIWSDNQIGGGDEWNKNIFEELTSSQIILLLISKDFINSRFCYEKEMTAAMSLHDSGRAIVIPIMLYPCECSGHPFKKLQMLPTNPRSINEWPDKDRACISIIADVENKIDKLLSQLENIDIDWRKNEVEDLLAEGNLLQCCNRLMDFCSDFSKERKHKLTATAIKAAYNSLIKEGKADMIERRKLGEEILNLLEEVRFPVLLVAA